jgi:ABC-2 type transport system permease protein
VVQGLPRGKPLILAARIRGKPAAGSAGDSSDKKSEGVGQDKEPEKKADVAGPKTENGDPAKSKDDKKNKDAKSDPKADEKKPPEKKPMDVIYVADIDLMSWQFLRIRARPGEDEEINWRFENVTFLLNIIDSLSGDDAYVEIRKRHIRHSTLKVVEETTRVARDKELEQQVKFENEIKRQNDDREKKLKEVQKKFEDEKTEMEKKRKEGGDFNLADYQSVIQKKAMEIARLQQQQQVASESAERERTGKIDKIRRETDLNIQKIQNWYKFVAVALPPIPPLIIGLVVFARRRLREREGVSKARLR